MHCVVTYLFAHASQSLVDAGTKGELDVEAHYMLRQDCLQIVQQDLPVAGE